MTENDLSATEKEQLEQVRKSLRAQIASWSDLYSFLHKLVRQFHETRGNPSALADCLYMHHAFVLALEDLPEEGDVLAIVDRMAFLISHAPERVGAKLLFADAKGERPVQVVVIDKEALSQIMGESFSTTDGGGASGEEGSKKILH